MQESLGGSWNKMKWRGWIRENMSLWLGTRLRIVRIEVWIARGGGISCIWESQLEPGTGSLLIFVLYLLGNIPITSLLFHGDVSA